MQANFDDSFARLIVHEGGYCNDAHDPGGMTTWGVTHIDWAAWIGHEPTEAEMRSITQDDVKPLYKKKYWDALSCDELPNGVDYAVFDFGVNSGIGRAARFLQKIVHVTQDGAIGPQTIAAVNDFDPALIVKELCDARQQFLESLSTFSVFGKGWTRRVQEVAATAEQMVA